MMFPAYMMSDTAGWLHDACNGCMPQMYVKAWHCHCPLCQCIYVQLQVADALTCSNANPEVCSFHVKMKLLPALAPWFFQHVAADSFREYRVKEVCCSVLSRVTGDLVEDWVLLSTDAADGTD
eukprot:2512679-Rhodomonas_salina.2